MICDLNAYVELCLIYNCTSLNHQRHISDRFIFFLNVGFHIFVHMAVPHCMTVISIIVTPAEASRCYMGIGFYLQPSTLVFKSISGQLLLLQSSFLAYTFSLTRTQTMQHHVMTITLFRVYRLCYVLCQSYYLASFLITINVLKFWTLYFILFWPKLCFLCSSFVKYLVEWQTV